MAICAVIDNVTNKLVNTIVAEVTNLPPDGCRLLEVPEEMIWDEGVADFVTPPPAEEISLPPDAVV